jgi:hypothetical protein
MLDQQIKNFGPLWSGNGSDVHSLNHRAGQIKEFIFFLDGLVHGVFVQPVTNINENNWTIFLRLGKKM